MRSRNIFYSIRRSFYKICRYGFECETLSSAMASENCDVQKHVLVIMGKKNWAQMFKIFISFFPLQIWTSFKGQLVRFNSFPKPQILLFLPIFLSTLPLLGQFAEFLVQASLEVSSLGRIQGLVLHPTPRIENPFLADSLPGICFGFLPTSMNLWEITTEEQDHPVEKSISKRATSYICPKLYRTIQVVDLFIDSSFNSKSKKKCDHFPSNRS